MKLIGTKVKRDWRYLSVIGLLLVVTWLVFVIRSNEPSYQGETLSQWLDALPDRQPELQGDSQWRRAFRHMGTNAIPFLLKRIQAEDSVLEAKLMDWAEKHDVSVVLPFKRSYFRQQRAAIGFRLLGSQAMSAVPELVDLMKRGGESGWFAAYALSGIGQEAVLPLAEALTNQAPEIRTSAASALCGLKDADGSSAVPNLIAVFSDTNRMTRLLAINALRHIGKRPDLVVPALSERLTDKDGVIRDFALSARAGITNASHEWTAAELLGGDRPATNGRTNDSRKPPTPLKSPNPYE
jgi:hypothetical protein